MTEETSGTNSSDRWDDPQPTIVACVGLVIVLLVSLIAASMLLKARQYIVPITTAAMTAVASIVGAYFGVKSANTARRDADKASQRHEARVTALAASLNPGEASDALKRVEDHLQKVGLAPQPQRVPSPGNGAD